MKQYHNKDFFSFCIIPCFLFEILLYFLARVVYMMKKNEIPIHIEKIY